MVYGRDFDGETIPLESITGEMGEVIIRCQVMDVEAREIRNEKTILIFPVTDFTDSIVVKMFLRNEQVPEVTESVKKGAFLKLKGVTTIDRFDSELTIGNITGIKKIANFTSTRNGYQSSEACGASLSHQDERYGWCQRCKGIGKTCL